MRAGCLETVVVVERDFGGDATNGESQGRHQSPIEHGGPPDCRGIFISAARRT